jgi:hypothetical protein
MKDIELEDRLRKLGMSPDKARAMTRKVRDELHPVAAVAAAKVLAARSRDGDGMGSLGFSVTGGAKGAASGASSLSMLGPYGIAVGAIIGGLVAAFAHKGTKPQRKARAAQVLQQLAAYPAASVGRTIEWGQKKEPTSGYYLLIEALAYGDLFTGWGATLFADHPGTLLKVADYFVDGARSLIRAAGSAPLGSQLSIQVKGIDGKNDAPFTFSIANPGVTDPVQVSQQLLMPMVKAMLDRNPKGARGSAADTSSNNTVSVFALMADKLMSELGLPNVSAAIATQPTATVPTPVVAQAAQVAQSVVNAGVVPSLVTPVQGQPQVLPTIPDASQPPIPYGPSPAYAPTQTSLPPVQAASAGILQSLMSADGASMVSPDAQQLVSDVAAEGVTKTPAGPSSTPGWIIPLLLGIGGMIIILPGKKGGRRHKGI